MQYPSWPREGATGQHSSGGAAAGRGGTAGRFLPVSQDEAWRQDKYSANNSQRLQFGVTDSGASFFPFFFFLFFFCLFLKNID